MFDYLSIYTYLVLAGFISNINKTLAYLDPGSGSFILQILIASLLAGLLFFKTFWRRITSVFRKPEQTEQDFVKPPDENDKAK